jgi:hypothetical protein
MTQPTDDREKAKAAMLRLWAEWMPEGAVFLVKRESVELLAQAFADVRAEALAERDLEIVAWLRKDHAEISRELSARRHGSLAAVKLSEDAKVLNAIADDIEASGGGKIL